MKILKSALVWASLLFVAICALATFTFGRSRSSVLIFTQPQTGSFAFEVLNDQMFRFEVFPGRHRPVLRTIKTTDMVRSRSFAGPTTLKRTAHGFETATIRVSLIDSPFCFRVQRLDQDLVLSEFCPQIPGAQALVLRAPGMTQTYGLGARFLAGGAIDNSQLPILYALGKGNENFALFLDNTSKQSWDLSQQPWRIEMTGGATRGYWFTGRDLRDLHHQFMDFVSHSPVLPSKAVGL